jgi:organic hydroperoxide reductase OsmC/OhrA
MEDALVCAIPPEFEGPGKGYSPEDFFLLAVTNCFVATFKVFAEKSKLQFEDLNIQSELTVDRNEHGVPWMAKVFLDVDLINPSQPDQAARLLTKTSQSCFVLNSIKSEKVLNLKVNGQPIS